MVHSSGSGPDRSPGSCGPDFSPGSCGPDCSPGSCGPDCSPGSCGPDCSPGSCGPDRSPGSEGPDSVESRPNHLPHHCRLLLVGRLLCVHSPAEHVLFPLKKLRFKLPLGGQQGRMEGLCLLLLSRPLLPQPVRHHPRIVPLLSLPFSVPGTDRGSRSIPDRQGV